MKYLSIQSQTLQILQQMISVVLQISHRYGSRLRFDVVAKRKDPGLRQRGRKEARMRQPADVNAIYRCCETALRVAIEPM